MKGWMTVSGGVLLHLTFGTIYCFGNLSPYIASYMHMVAIDSSRTYKDILDDLSYVYAAALSSQALAMPLGGVLERRYGVRPTVIIGCVVMLVGVFTSSVSCRTISGLLPTYGLLFGCGVGIAYSAPMVAAFRWQPLRMGLVTGFIVAGFGAGAFLFNQAATAFVNPKGGAGGTDDNDPFPAEVAEKVPDLFLLLGVCYLALQLIGIALLRPNIPPNEAVEFAHALRDVDQVDSGGGGGPAASVISSESNYPASPSNALATTSLLAHENGARVRDIFSSHFFWLLFVSFLLNGTANVYVVAEWKYIGLNAGVGSDKFLATVGSVGSIFNAIGRLVLGAALDRHGYVMAMAGLCVCYVTLLVSLPWVLFGVHGNGASVSYFVWVCGLFGCLGGNFAVFPSTLSALFGIKDVGRNYGLLFLSQVPAAWIGGVALSSGVVNSIHPAARRWKGVSLVFAALPATTLALTMIFRHCQRRLHQSLLLAAEGTQNFGGDICETADFAAGALHSKLKMEDSISDDGYAPLIFVETRQS